MPMSEDCLYLNVLTPAKKANDGLPVMVWMHGGGLTTLSGNEGLFNGFRLPLKGVVLVNVNMRLGPIGCIAHPLLSRESVEGASGNYLFLDMVAALKWVHQNISAFGGDPDRVTIFGASGGSAKVIHLMASPLAKGLFHRAIGQSFGTSGMHLKEMEGRGEKLFAKLGVDENKDPVAAARALPWEKIIESSNDLPAELSIPPHLLWDSVVDGWFLTDTPANIFRAGKQNAVPFIMGANLGELTGPGMILIPQVIPDYVNMFRGANEVGGQAYAYVFNHVPARWQDEGAVASHQMELGYVFGDWHYKGVLWGVMNILAKAAGANSADPGFTEADRKVSEVMMDMWTNFARTGDPSIRGVVDWPAWDEAKDQYLYITESPEVRSGFSKVAQK
jgi:para-nitrobenzyl esterase